MSPTLTTFLFEIANFLALAGFLAWFFFKPVRGVIERQRQALAVREQEAAGKLAEAEKQLAAMEGQRRALVDELERMRAAARDTARQEAAAIMDGARAQADRERSRLRREALQIEKAQTGKLGRAVAGATHTIMARFLGQVEGPELERALLDAACRELAASAVTSLGSVTIESASPLAAEARAQLETALGGARKNAEFRVVPGLIVGVRVSTDHGLIDVSGAGLAAVAEQAVNDEISAIVREESHDE